MRSAQISVFAVEETAVQIMWLGLPAPEVCFEVGDQRVAAQAAPPAYLRVDGRPTRSLVRPKDAFGGPGAITVDDLQPATTYDVCVTAPGLGRRVIERVTTLPPPPGRLLAKFATVNDLHLGEDGFGAHHTIRDRFPLPDGWEGYTYRCARTALHEAIEWGASQIIVKGDLTDDGAPAEFREAGRLLAGLPVPVEITFGNHEFHDLETDGRLLLAEFGFHVPRQAWSLDLPGIRVVLGHSALPGSRSGRIDERQRERVVQLAQEAPGAAFVVLHHHPQRFSVPNQYPPGIPGPQATALLDALADANPASVVATGHTHRHRRHRHGPLVAVEVGSPKDYPGTWAGYAVHEGGIRQVVRRVAAPNVIAWTESTFWALGGVWGRWSVGRRTERCFTHRWPRRD